jgi:hypothetical protein
VQITLANFPKSEFRPRRTRWAGLPAALGVAVQP